MAQKTSKSGFVDTSKPLVFIRENMVFGGLGGIWRHPGGIQRHPGGIWRLLGSIWRLPEASRLSRWHLGGWLLTSRTSLDHSDPATLLTRW